MDTILIALKEVFEYLNSKGLQPKSETSDKYLEYIFRYEESGFNKAVLKGLEKDPDLVEPIELPLVKDTKGNPKVLNPTNKTTENMAVIACNFETWYKSAFPEKTNGPAAETIKEAVAHPLTYKQVLEFAEVMLGLEDLKAHYEKIIADTQYVGFDPRVMGSILRNICIAADDYDPTKDKFYAEMTFLIILFLQRGTSVIDPRKIGTMSRETREKVAFLKKKYGLLSKIGPKANKIEAVTLSRIAACYPTLVCRVMHDALIQRPISVETMQKHYTGFPAFLRNSCWFSIIYEGAKYGGIVKALLHYQILEGRLINQKNADYKLKDEEEVMEETIKYASAAFRSELIPEAERKNLCTEYFSTIKTVDQKAWEATFNDTFPYAVDNVKLFFGQVNY